MFSRLTFQSIYFKLPSFPITQLMNRNNAIPHIRGSLSCTEGPSWVRWWAVTHPGFITVWFIPMAAKTCFNWPVWAKKAKSIYWDCWPVTLSHLFQVPSQRLEREIQTQFFSIIKIDHQTKNYWWSVVNWQLTFKPPTYSCNSSSQTFECRWY